MFRMALWLWLGSSSSLLADEVGLVRIGETWRYFKGTNEASFPITAWRQLNFDDSAWLSGPSGFGYYSLGAATILSDVPGYPSVFLRKKFTLGNPAAVKWLVLRADYDDGFVAYLNGVEIARRGLAGEPGTPVPFNASAGYHPYGVAEEIDVSAFAPMLVAGENILAIQAHNGVFSTYSFEMAPELLANFQRGPFVQNAATNHIQIIWKTPVFSDTKVEYGVSTALGSVFADTNRVVTHVTMLTNLLPGTTYFYRISSTGAGQTAVSPIETFRTLKTEGPLSFVMFGDSGWGSSGQMQIASVIKSAQPDLVLHGGDVVYGSFTPGQTDLRCLSVYASHIKNTPYFFALGNHDLYSGDQAWLDAFYLPTNSVSPLDHFLARTSPEHFYSFEHGDAHFAVLFLPYFSQYKLTAGNAQYNWLTNDLATTTKPWKILLCHIPMRSSAWHRIDDTDYNRVHDRLELQEVLLPVASKYGVQLVLSGHDHIYERLAPTNGVHFLVSGGGGVLLYPLYELDFGSELFWSRYNCVKVTIDGDTLAAQALGQTGEVFDAMTIRRAVPPPQMYQASWHTPGLATNAPADGLGDVYGQKFDFHGTPLPTLSGQFSNLGRVFVNNNRTNLYVGLEQVMIYGNNNVFLFVESPRLPGVTNLMGLGNGVVDPLGQGVDGLDFLENLSFANFAPGIGCLLGDKRADGQFRSFARPYLALDIGQGVFKLNAALADVPDAQVQQFNPSLPAFGPVTTSNANFIEVAIPLRELGGAQAGDLIKIGAVVGGDAFDTNRQTRLLDSGFLGTRLIGSGQGPVVLEGVSVQLAFDPDADADGLTREQELVLGTNPDNPDSDGDGLRDGWEVQHGLNPRSAAGPDGADGDPDNDGNTNAQEQRAGTDPRDSASGFRVSLVMLAANRFRISWPASVGRKYQIEFADNTPTQFTSLANPAFPRTAKSLTESYEVELALPMPAARYYRVRLVP